MLAAGKLLVSANGRVRVRELGAGRRRGFFCPLHFGNGGAQPAEVVRQVQTVRTPLKAIVGFVKVQFDLHARISMAGRVTNPVGAKFSVKRRVRRQTLV